MHKFPLVALSATVLLALNTAYAANLRQKDAGKLDFPNQVAPSTDAPAVNGDDNPMTVIFLDQNNLQVLPNPYSNPGPRMISDAWAMRT